PAEYNARMPPSSRTDANLQVALAGEADANRRYLAYGIRALAEGRADIAQLFFEAAGAETIHALEHLRAMGAVASTRENLVTAASGEVQEIDVTLPRMIREAEEDGRPDAAASFRLALERERHHRDMFRHALATFDGRAPAPPPAIAAATAAPARRAEGAVSAGGGVMAALAARGMARAEAEEVARRIGRHPDILLSALAIFELGLAPQRLGAPVRDALVMAVAFGGASVVPLLPFMVTQGLAALGLSAA